MLLVIGKPAEFDEHNLPVRGQCQPYAKGWQLRIFEKGKQEVLYEETYYVCRQIQLECAGKPADEIKAVVKDMHVRLTEDLQETAAIEQQETRKQASLDDQGSTVVQNPNEEDTVRYSKDEMDGVLRRRRQDFDF